MQALPPKERRFVAEYITDQNATQAAIRCGYSKKTADVQGPRLLGKVRVRAAVDALLAKITEKAEITAEDILRSLAKIAFLDFRKAFNDDGTLKSVRDMPPEVAEAISSIETDDAHGEIKKIKFWDKTKALEMLGRHLEMFTDKTKLTDGAGAPVIIQMVPAKYDTPEDSKSRDNKSL